MIPCEDKMRILAQQSATLRSFLQGPTIFRWFDGPLVQGQIALGPCVTVVRVSSYSQYSQGGALAQEWIRFQLDCQALEDPGAARQLAYAVSQWFGTVSFFSPNQFNSPPTAPPNFPNFQLNQRHREKVQLGKPVLVETLDYRVCNNLNF